MIKFFRQIRRQLLGAGNSGKYLKYAIGEIVLVMVGILLALQVNNWNEDRKSIIQEKGYLNTIYADLTDEIKNMDHNRTLISDHYLFGMEVMKAKESKESGPIDSVKLATYLGWDLSQIIPVDRDENIWDKIKGLGTNTFIISDSLNHLLNDFYVKYDYQIERFNQLPKKLRQELRELTGYCHNASGLEVMKTKGIEYYGASSPETRKCILSIDKTQKLVGAIMVTSIVNTKLYEDLKIDANHILGYMRAHYDFIRL